MMINAKSTSVVLLVGGAGSRFSPLSEPPKQLSKLNKNLILMHIIKNFKKYGLNHFIFPLGFKKKFFIKIFFLKKNISKYKFNILKKKFKKEDLKTNKINISFFDAGNNTNKLTRISKSLNLTAFWRHKSSNLPGVATRRSTPFFSFVFWALMPTPPKTTADVNFKYLP